ncbi:hypothetical protein IQ249_19415 [Lusitaniella coriacea LEGE 07157]|uniref:Uncharacterized protein n=1 Tax=Lusitaniella coriacea LEGE 07157 TaxID=945747 RepID=A0A8J7J5J1_9CYAN|nr:COP23 domain-containing protein [Lusitaniella coriacea]MBE9118069.1 hypothetical protein [Lusitaniella coriacea LEGE 07157]
MNTKSFTQFCVGTAIALGTITLVAQPSQACPGQSNGTNHEGNCASEAHPIAEPCERETPCASEGPPIAEPIDECHSQNFEQCATPIARPIFSCESHGGMPTTLVQTPGGKFPIIHWVSDYFSGSGYNPYTRCREVTGRFQRYSDNGTLSYITTGIMNNQPVVCVSGYAGGPCQGLLFTLKRGQDASRVVQQLFDLPSRATGPLYESGSRFYLNMDQYLRNL